jgi:histidine triad (HIT) family protein
MTNGMEIDVNELRRQLIEHIKSSSPQPELAIQQINAMSDEQLLEFLKQFERPCFFCEVVKGNVDVVRLYEDENFLAFLDAYPAIVGHSILISKNHELEKDKAGRVIEIIEKLRDAFYKKGFTGFNVVYGSGSAVAYDHFFLHFIPRKENDGIELWKRLKPSKQELEEIGKEIRAELEGEKEARQVAKRPEAGPEAGKMEQEAGEKKEEKKEKGAKDFVEEKIENILRFIKERIP